MKKKLVFFLFLAVFLTFLSVEAKIDFENQRQAMVKSQIEARGISDSRVLGAMRQVERDKFVPAVFRHLSYTDRPLSIGKGQTISQPFIVALMSECLALKGGERVLEIGTGSGYQAAILAKIAKEVYTIEIIPSLAQGAKKRLEEMGYKNIKVKIGDGFLGWPEFAPFDGIMVTCAPPEVPPPLIEQLKEGGRMVIPVGEFFQELKVLEKKKGKIIIRDVIPVRFVPMTGEGAEKE